MSIWLLIGIVAVAAGLLMWAAIAWLRLLFRWADSHIELQERRARYFWRGPR